MTHYHFIGIGGAGLSPIARVLLEKGHQVSGSDLVMSRMAQELRDLGVKVSIGHDAANVFGADVVMRSSAIPDNNVEVLAGMNAHIPVVKRVDFLEDLTTEKEVIAVAGTHGKTTTTAMISSCLTELGKDPSFVIGGISKNLGTNAHAGEGEYFVIEADEYDRMFLGLSPQILIITNIEHDHPDCYPTPEEYFQAFVDFTGKIQPGGVLLACSDHPGTAKLIHLVNGSFKLLTYGTKADSNYLIRDIHHVPGSGVCFRLSYLDFNVELNLIVPGNHNAYNATAALAVTHQLGLSSEKSIQSVEKYSGTGRRFDILGVVDGITVIDDYGHHPTEIRATLSATRCRYPDQKIWAVWQPHTYSRTQTLADEFKAAFTDADHVIVTEIYASREKKQDYSSKEVVEKMSHPDVRQIAELSDVTDYLIHHIKPGDVLLVLSAGDADQISRDVLKILNDRKGKTHDG
ncbi:MAG TPA: UDP-N-acetylmuramate--L-alanine ligase [Pelolinea sp.]|nr:UDP-N-acetylmuramate--L-alanine ligase [Pelolinea sp.]